MVLRRAARFGKLIGIDQPFMAQVVDSVIDQLGGHYTDLVRKRAYILQTVNDEEERFHRTLNTGLSHLEELIAGLRAAGETVIPGKDAFQLWDTYGAPGIRSARRSTSRCLRVRRQATGWWCFWR